MYSNEHTLQDLRKQAFHRLDMDDTANEIDVKYAYRQVAGNLINQLTWSIQFKDGVLRLGIASPALRDELWMRREGLTKSINHTLGRNAVKKIVLFTRGDMAMSGKQ